jgi:GWxTD domain-containing protein
MRVVLFCWIVICLVLGGARSDAQRVDSLVVYEAAVAEKPKDGLAWMRLGELYLAAKKTNDAKKAFNNALDIQKSARGYTGLGDIAAIKKSSYQRAFLNYRKALGEDLTYRDAQLGIARVNAKMGNEDAELSYLKVIKLDPTYKPGYQELIVWYKDAQLVQSDALIQLCERYVEQFPDDPTGYLHLTEAQVERYQYDDVLMVAKEARQRFPDDVRWLALAGQAHAVRGNSARALLMFQSYLKKVADSERVYYDDLSLVGTKDDVAQLTAATPESEREAFLKRFWETRDGALMLGGNARRAEHYRRVWYARTFFGRHQNPWDKRGEVYIRYGEPNYRSRSGGQNVPPPLEVQLFKEKKITEFYKQTTSYRAEEPRRTLLPMMMPGNTYFPGQTDDGRDTGRELISSDQAERMTSIERIDAIRNGAAFEVNSASLPSGWLWEVIGPGGDVRLNLPPGMTQGIEPTTPIDRDSNGSIIVPWESWVYLYVGNGREFAFTDQFMNGGWDFPAVPNNLWHSALVSEVNNRSSAVEFMESASALPEHFDVPPGADLLGFYYDSASFRSESGQTELEVYFGIPPEEVTLNREGDRVELAIERSLVLAQVNGDSVYRTTDELVFRKTIEEATLGGLFVELASIDVPPGDYILGVKLADRTSGKWGMYREEVTVPAFADSLAISDIEMAWTVSDSPDAEKFKKGDVWVVPAPTRSYETTRDARLYYEVYNLKQDTFGQSKYQVTYTIRPNIERGEGAVGILVSGLRKMFVTSAEPEFTVQYEGVTNSTDETIYFELETETLKPGLKMVEVTVLDLNSNQEAKRRAMFHVVEPAPSAEAKDPYDAAFEEAMKGLLGK